VNDKESTKYDKGKLRWNLVPIAALEVVVAVLQFGAKTYGAFNWRKGTLWSRYFNAALRHLWAWWKGESVDPESGESHLAHACVNILFLLEYEREGIGIDDREDQA